MISSVMLKSVEKELFHFYKEIQKSNKPLESITKGAFTQARVHLKHNAFIELSNLSNKDFYDNENFETWKNCRVLAADGSTLSLPVHKGLEMEFPAIKTGCNADVVKHMAKISLFHDVLNCITLDAQISSFQTSERALLKSHLENVELKNSDIILLDRGYPSIALMYNIIDLGAQFCIRMKDNWWIEVKDFLDDERTSKNTVFTLPKKDMELISDSNVDELKVTVRLVKIPLPNNTVEILATSLLCEKTYSNEDLAALYHLRWGIEEAYKTLKEKLNLSEFSGKTPHAIKQDFYAKIFMMNLCSIMSFPIKERIKKESEKKLHKQKINFSNALSIIKENWLSLFYKRKTKGFFEELGNVLHKTKDIIRYGRQFKRKHTPKKPPSMHQKGI
jgi:hypothetical protein